MGACMSSEFSSGNVTQSLVVDVQKVIADHVWRVFRGNRSARCARGLLKRHDFTIEVPMKFFHFEKTHQELSLRTEGSDDHLNDVTSDQNGKLPQGDKVKPERKGLQTQFRNNTEETQTYSFHFEKTRRSEARVSQSRGFSFGGKTDFSVNLPKILPGGELGAELDMHMEVSKAEEQTFEETSTTSATSDVIVSPNSRCTVNVVLEDHHFTADYKVHIIMKMPATLAEIYVRNKEDQVVYKHFLKNLPLIFPVTHHVRDQRGQICVSALRFVIEGVIHATQVSNQNVHIDSQPLERSTSTDD